MRLKKIMSLVLAGAMALSLVTVASAADTEVYFEEDFSSYSEISYFHQAANVIDVSANKDSNHNLGATSLNAAVAKRAEVGAPVMAFAGTSNMSLNTNHHSFTTNSFGNKALLLMSQDFIKTGVLENPNLYAGNAVGYGTVGILAKSAWDLTANADETYIISYEMDAETTKFPVAHGSNNYQRAVGSIWEMSDGSGRSTTGVFKYNVPAPTTREATEGETPDSQHSNLFDTPSADYGFEAIKSKWNSGTAATRFNSGDAHRIAFGYKYNNVEEPMRIVAVDGAAFPGWADSLKNTSDDSTMDHTKYTKLDGVYIAFPPQLSMSLANIRMYTIKNDSFKAVIENNTDVPLSTKTIRVKFANPVSPSTWTKEGTVVKADGVAMNADQYSVGTLNTVVDGTEIYSYVDVTFTNLEEGTTYTIDFVDTITNEIATQLGETNSVATFSTKLPDVKIMPLTVVGAESLIANGELQAVKATLINNTSAPKNVALIYAVYAGDKLADIVYINDSVTVDGAEYEVGLKLASAGTVKAFAWDGMTSLKPYTGSVQLTVAAAQ